MNKMKLIICILITFNSSANCVDKASYNETRKVTAEYMSRQLDIENQTTQKSKEYNSIVGEYSKCNNERWRSSHLAKNLMKTLQGWDLKIKSIDSILNSNLQQLIGRFLETEARRVEMQRSGNAEAWNILAYCDSYKYGNEFLDLKERRNLYVGKVTEAYKEFSKGCNDPSPKSNFFFSLFENAGAVLGDIYLSFI